MILFLSVIVFFFTLFALSKDDFILIRKNVTLRIMFDISVVVGIVGLFFSRLFFAISQHSLAYANPLVFFIIPYFPGLTLSGFLLGSLVMVYILTVRQKMPTGRIYDIFSQSLLIATSLYFVIQGLIQLLHKQWFTGGVSAAIVIILVSLFSFFQSLLQKSSWRDGSIAFVNLVIVSLLVSILQVVQLRLRSIPTELPFFGILLAFLFFSFLIRSFRKHE